MRLLLDAHISPAVARALVGEGFDVLALQTWRAGEYRDASDERILAAAYVDGCTLVTYDCQAIPELLKEWAETGQHHGGFILVDERTISQSGVGGLVRALRVLVERSGQESWIDRVVFLRSAQMVAFAARFQGKEPSRARCPRLKVNCFSIGPCANLMLGEGVLRDGPVDRDRIAHRVQAELN